MGNNFCTSGVLYATRFCRDALISLKICRRIYHCKIDDCVNFDSSNCSQNVGRVFDLIFRTKRYFFFAFFISNEGVLSRRQVQFSVF